MKFLFNCLFLVIFPTVLMAQNNNQLESIEFSTFLGGENTDDTYETSMALDQNGRIFISGFTLSKDFPVTPNAFCTKFNGGQTDRFISRLSRDLSLLESSTFIGGKGVGSPYVAGNGNELGHAVAVDSDGNVFIAGYTKSPDFPTTEGAYDRSFNGGTDVYVAKFDNNLGKLISSTFLGGTGDEGFMWPRIDLTINNKGEIYVAGLTHSVDFPISESAYDKSFNGGPESGDVFIVKLDNNLSKLLASTYLGGTDNEWRVSIVADKNSDVFICGETASPDFPTSAKSYNEKLNVMKDIFISRFDKNLSKLKASTYFGGSDLDEALGMRLSEKGSVYITGYTQSKDFPTTEGVYKRQWSGGDRDAFAAVFNNNLKKLTASTFFGGSARDMSKDLIVDSNGNIYVTGITKSPDFPGVKIKSGSTADKGYNSFLAKFSHNLKDLSVSSVFGGDRDDKAHCLLSDNEGNIFVAGDTSSKNFPVTNKVYGSTYGGGFNDCFIVKFDIKKMK